jgi:ElaB/YqjD/DUF883 family membrane-anchored ribosome-binding protein
MTQNPEGNQADHWHHQNQNPTTGSISAFDKAKSAISSKLHEAANTVNEKFHPSSATNSKVSKVGNQTAEWLNRSADYIEGLDPQQVKSDIQEQVRRNPGRSLLIAAAAGLVLGTLIRRG